LLAILSLSISEGSAAALDFALTATPEGQPAISLTGEIFIDDNARFGPVLVQMFQRGQSPALLLDSPGGNILGALRIASIIQKYHLAVFVPAGSMCASACFLLFAASQSRHASSESQIGVHSASLAGDENQASFMIDTIMARSAKGFGVPDGIIGRMVTTKPSDMAWLTTSELKDMNVIPIVSNSMAAPAQSEPAANTPTVADSEAPGPVVVPSVVASPNEPERGPLDYRPGAVSTGEVIAFTVEPEEPKNISKSERPAQRGEGTPDYVPRGTQIYQPLKYVAGN
jgi:hypothetical protein